MNHNHVAVVVPAYNCAETLYRALYSVIQQTHSAREIIIVDDCSTDSTLEIAEDFKKKFSSEFTKIIVSRNEKNSGPSATRNRGISLSSSPWIAFLDSDDWWLNEKLELQLKIAQETGAELVGTEVSVETPVSPNNFALSYEVVVERDFYWRNCLVTSSVLMKKERGFIFDEKMKFSEDYDLWMRYVRSHKACLIKAPLVVMGKPLFGFSGLSAKLWSMEKGELKVLKAIPNAPARYLAYGLSLLKFVRRVVITKVRSF